MKNKDKFKTDCEAKEAYKQWCKDRVSRGIKCDNECALCFGDWLDMEEDDYGTDCPNDNSDDEWYWRVEFPLGLQNLEEESEEDNND